MYLIWFARKAGGLRNGRTMIRLFTSGRAIYTKKRIALLIVSVFLLSVMLWTLFKPEVAHPAIIKVPDDYSAIQAAINAASPGDTIQVAAGTYYEHVVVNKPLTIIGENVTTTIIDGNGTGNVIRVTADEVRVSGFTLQNGGKTYLNTAGIFLDNVIGSTIVNNNLSYNNFYGIFVMGGNDNNVSNNLIMFNGGDGICLNNSGTSTISNNMISNNGIGIFIRHYSRGIAVINNTISNNRKYGIDIHISSYNTLTNNNMTGNEYNFGVTGTDLSHFIHDVDTSNTVDGKPVYYLISQSKLVVDPFTYPDIGYLGIVNSTNITVKDLNLTKNLQGVLFAFTNDSTIEDVSLSNNLDGIDVFYSSENKIINSTISSYTCGIRLRYCSNIITYDTLLKNCWYGIFLHFSNNNTIYHNNFINNTYQVYLYQSADNTWDNGNEGNYWSDYLGLDLDGDGIGDTMLPHDGVDYYPLMNPWN